MARPSGRSDSAVGFSGEAVARPGGQLPVVSGQDAPTRTQLDFWNENRGVIKIGGSNPPDCTPTFIAVEDLEILWLH
jgi:hypothetical protein